MTTRTIEELEARRRELITANENAPGWGAAVGARNEEIRAIERELRRRSETAPTPAAAPANGQPAIDQAMLRHLVDVVWQVATESEAVPSTDWADRMIENALEATPAQLESRRNPRTDAVDNVKCLKLPPEFFSG